MVNVSRLPGAYEHHWNWQLHGSCRATENSLFFHPPGERGAAHDEREAAAKAICTDCPVRLDCLRHALTAREPYGVWGGLTEDERHRLLARGLRLAQPTA
ncbi:WhiB family transcriptional regulator [Kitasatospora sp. NBC_01250]|uniref:WhiB family transcriptional regulator n=1 Tax=unclassified Kitasatospora TaxID=2633591 RepID=UPI002E149035|nr:MULTISPECIES: WhiB family transcriptional regulator [unclassified Kitasatospora]WSJ64706.1 WhiB family transcriptional regulator [Kitasatospora sp. NBC_01302]